MRTNIPKRRKAEKLTRAPDHPQPTSTPRKTASQQISRARHALRLDRHAGSKIVRRIARRAGITKSVGPHTLRHTFILPPSMPACRSATCQKPRHTPTPRTTIALRPRPPVSWTVTPPTSSPPSSPAPHADARNPLAPPASFGAIWRGAALSQPSPFPVGERALRAESPSTRSRCRGTAPTRPPGV